MITLALIVLAAFGVYLGLSVFMLGIVELHEEHEFWVKPEEVVKQFPTEDAIRAAEAELERSPQNLKLRISILGAHLFKFQDEAWTIRAKKHARWLIENHPEIANAGKPETSFPFRFRDCSPEEKHDLMILWEKKFEDTGRDRRVLSNAAHFFTNIDVKFATKCKREIAEREPLNPDELRDLARLLCFGLKESDNQDERDEFLEPLRLYTKICSWPWTQNDYRRLESLRARFGAFLWPRPLTFMILYLRGTLARALSHRHSRQNYILLADAATTALKAGDLASARRFADSLRSCLPEVETRVKWPPFLRESYTILARLALKDGDLETVKLYLDKKASNPLGTVFDFLFDDLDIIADLVKSGHKDIAVGFMQKRAKEAVNQPEVELQIKLVKNGEIPYADKWLKKEG